MDTHTCMHFASDLSSCKNISSRSGNFYAISSLNQRWVKENTSKKIKET